MKLFKEFRMPPITMGRDNTIVGVRDHDVMEKDTETESVPYWSWNNKKIGEGTMSSGIFDKDNDKAKDAARNFAKFLKLNRMVVIAKDEETGKDSKDLEAYIKELMGYVFDDELLDNLSSGYKFVGKKANDIVTKRLRELGVKIR